MPIQPSEGELRYRELARKIDAFDHVERDLVKHCAPKLCAQLMPAVNRIRAKAFRELNELQHAGCGPVMV